MADTLDLSQFTNVWTESFDSGYGALSRTWGPGVHVGGGAVTLNSTADNTDSGTMLPPTGSTAGNGFGLYSFTLKMEQGDAPGPYALIWPSTDGWPGPELDLVEINQGGQAYSTIHWKGGDGSNQFKSYNLDGVDVKQTHTYAMDWEQGRISLYVDGRQMWTTTEHVPDDAAHGGENSAPGVGMQTWWSAGAQHGGGYANTMTVYDVSYAAPAAGYHGGTGDGTAQPITLPITQGPTEPVQPTIGTGPDSLVLQLSQDFYKASAQYTVAVDGQPVGGPLTAAAAHAAGQADTLTIHGDWAAGPHTVTIAFLNDAYDGTPATDRNLYLDGASLNGTALGGAARTLLGNGAVDVAFTKAAAQPYTQTIGSGADSLVLKLAQDAYNGAAQYTVAVDGRQVGGTLTAHALHASGPDDLITVKGDFAAGPHKVAVTFLNDAYDGTPSTDRNLYLDGASLNGAAVDAGVKAMFSAGPAEFAFA